MIKLLFVVLVGNYSKQCKSNLVVGLFCEVCKLL